MNIEISNLGKRYNTHWIFRKVNYTFQSTKKYAITGPNGSGKSTLLQTLGNFILQNEGSIRYEINGTEIPPEKIHRHISIAAPYLDLIEEMTLNEFLNFHQKMKGWLPHINNEMIIDLINLSDAVNKQIRYFSSGMKQRVKLAQAIFSNATFVLLDEPATNLDKPGIAVYRKLIHEFMHDRLLIVSSNDEQEYAFCNEHLYLPDFK